MTNRSLKYLLLAGTLLGTLPHAFASNPLEEALSAYNKSSIKALDTEDLSEKIKPFILSLIADHKNALDLYMEKVKACDALKTQNDIIAQQNEELGTENEALNQQLQAFLTGTPPEVLSFPRAPIKSDLTDEEDSDDGATTSVLERLNELSLENKLLSQQVLVLQEQCREAQDEHERQLALKVAELSAIQEAHEKELSHCAAELSASSQEKGRRLAELQETMTKELAFRHQCIKELAALVPTTSVSHPKPSNEMARLGAEVGRWGKTLGGIGKALSERDGSNTPTSQPGSTLPRHLQAFLVVPHDFQVYRYAHLHPDVTKAASEQTQMTPEAFMVFHYAFYGQREERPYK